MVRVDLRSGRTMKRMTALIIAGVLLLGTACGGENQTNSGGTKADAGATAAQKPEAGSAEGQTADGADEVAEAAENGSAADDRQADDTGAAHYQYRTTLVIFFQL